MPENQNHPIRILTDHMCDLVIRLIETEQKLEEEKQRADNWYKNWLNMNEKFKEKEAELAAATEARQKIEDKLNEYIEKQQKGATKNGESN